MLMDALVTEFGCRRCHRLLVLERIIGAVAESQSGQKASGVKSLGKDILDIEQEVFLERPILWTSL